MFLGDRDPFRLFDLPPDASPDEIRRRYRQLALAYHPDRKSDDPERSQKFALVCEAYRAILKAREAAEQNLDYGTCPECGEPKALVPRIDGVMVCRKCLARPRQIRFLPPPVWTIIKCTFSIGCLLAATVALIVHFVRGEVAYAWVACGTGLVGLIATAALGFRFPVASPRDIRRNRDRRDHIKPRFPL